MAPKSKKKRSSQRPKPNDVQRKRVGAPHANAAQHAQIFGRLLVILTAPTLLATYSIYSFFRTGTENNKFQNNWSDALLICMVLFSILVAVFVSSLTVTGKLLKIPETQQQKRIRFITTINAVTVACTTVSYTVLLKGGYLEGLTTFLQANIFPSLSRGVNYVVSNIIGWAISGIVGNFCYDVIKRRIKSTEISNRSMTKKG